MPPTKKPPTTFKPPTMGELLGKREVERREKAVAAQEPVVVVAPIVPAAQSLVMPDEAVAEIERVAPQLFVAMVEKRHGLLGALKAVGVSSATFFTALDRSQALQGWYRGVKAAQAVMDVEEVGDVLESMTHDANDELMGNSARTAKMTLARTKLEQARWAAQKLLPALFGEKVETHSKVEIVVRRETKQAVKAAVEE